MIKRPLTAGEIELAQTIFGDAIDYAAVKVTEGKFIFFQSKGTAMAPDGNLYMYGCYCADYAGEDPYMRSAFVHEMTHVWQFQNKILDPVTEAAKLSLKNGFNYFAAYYFHLDDKKDLMDYGMEQQASIVQEYFLCKREGLASYARHCKNTCTDGEKIALYEKVLEKFFKNPAYAKQGQFPKAFKGKGPK